MSARFAVVRGRDLLPVAEITANGRPVSTMHELAHVVQQRGCQLTLSFDTSRFDISRASAGQKTIIGGFKSLSGMDSETEVIDQSLAGQRVQLSGFRAAPAGTAQHFPGNTRYTTVKLTRA